MDIFKKNNKFCDCINKCKLIFCSLMVFSIIFNIECSDLLIIKVEFIEKNNGVDNAIICFKWRCIKLNNMQQQNNQQQMQGQQMQQGQQGQAMITSKNLTILEDMMNYESLFYKKIDMYSKSCNDPQLKDICNKAAQLHKNHFDILYNYLNSHNKPAQQQQQQQQ